MATHLAGLRAAEEEGVRCHYGNVVVAEGSELGIAGDEVVGVRVVEKRKGLVIVEVG